MATVYEIPTSPTPQTFSITLSGVQYQCALRWNTASSCWTLDLSDANGNLILGSIPVIPGVNLLEQFDYLELGGALVASTDYDPNAVPTFDNLGSTGHLYWIAS